MFRHHNRNVPPTSASSASNPTAIKRRSVVLALVVAVIVAGGAGVQAYVNKTNWGDPPAKSLSVDHLEQTGEVLSRTLALAVSHGEAESFGTAVIERSASQLELSLTSKYTGPDGRASVSVRVFSPDGDCSWQNGDTTVTCANWELVKQTQVTSAKSGGRREDSLSINLSNSTFTLIEARLCYAAGTSVSCTEPEYVVTD